MPRNSSGNYTLPVGNPVITDTLIESANWANPTMADLGAELTNSLDRQGRGSMINSLKLADGSVVTPGLAFNSESSTGLYHPAAHILGIAVAGVAMALFGDNDVTFTKNVIAQQNVTVTGTTTLTGGISGVLSLPLGTAPLPSLAFTGDPNTGMYSPGADQIGWATNGVARGGIGAAGNWSIPAPTSGPALALAGATAASVGSGALQIQNDRLVTFLDSAGGLTNPGYIWYGSGNQMRFGTANATRLSIDSAGAVVIAAPASGAALTLAQGSTAALAVTGGAGVGAFGEYAGNGLLIGSTSLIVGQSSAGLGLVFQRGNLGLSFGTNNLSRIDVAAAGNVTINAPASGVALSVLGLGGGAYGAQVRSDSADTVVSAPYTNYGLVISNRNTTNNNYVGLSFNTDSLSPADTTMATIVAQCTTHAAGALGGNLRFFTTNANALAERMQIGSAGNVTINAPSSGVALAVFGTGTDAVKIVNDTAIIRGYDTANSLQAGYLSFNKGGAEVNLNADGAGANSLVLGSNNVRRLFISPAGLITLWAHPAAGSSDFQVATTAFVQGTAIAGGGAAWADASGSHAFNAGPYQNTNARPRGVCAWGVLTGAGANLQLQVASTSGGTYFTVAGDQSDVSGTHEAFVNGIVPPGHWYKVLAGGAGPVMHGWTELN